MTFPSSPSTGDINVLGTNAWTYDGAKWTRRKYVRPPLASLLPVTVTATTGGTAHTAGSWVEVVSAAGNTAATNHLVAWLLSANSTNATDTSTLLEIGTGGSGSETVVATVACGVRSGGTTTPIQIADLPLPIASGTRVAVRTRSARTATAITVAVGLSSTTATVTQAPTTWQLDTSTSKGLTITAPAGTGTPGAWTEIVSAASMTTAIQALHLCPQIAGSTNIANGTVDLDIGTGGSGSEVVAGSLRIQMGSAEAIAPTGPILLPLIKPAGTRIAARYTRSTTAALDLFVQGIPL